MKRKNIFLWHFLTYIFYASTASAAGMGVVFDYFNYGIQAVGDSSRDTSKLVSAQFQTNLRNSIDVSIGNRPLYTTKQLYFSNPNQLLDDIKSVNEGKISSYGDSLDKIVGAIDTYDNIYSVYEAAKGLLSIGIKANDLGESIDEISKLVISGDTDKLDYVIQGIKYSKSISDLDSALDEFSKTSRKVLEKIIKSDDPKVYMADLLGKSAKESSEILKGFIETNSDAARTYLTQSAIIDELRSQFSDNWDFNYYIQNQKIYSLEYKDRVWPLSNIFVLDGAEHTYGELMSGVEPGLMYSYENGGTPIAAIEEGVGQARSPVLSPITYGEKEIIVGVINNDRNSDLVKDSANNDLQTAPGYWSGNFVLNYLWDAGSFASFGYGDGGFSSPSKPEANAAATLTYYHLGEQEHQVNIRNVDYPGDYSYTAWGSWTEGDQRLAAFEADYVYASGISKLTPWVAVQKMAREDVSRLSGTATYSGVLSGVMIGDAGASSFVSGTGMVGMTANFNNDTITGGLVVMRGSASSAWATANFSTSLNSDIDGDSLKFNSQLTGAGISNAENWHSQIRGEFGGPQANEAGGMWAITKTDGSQATGTFHAKKETNQVAP